MAGLKTIISLLAISINGLIVDSIADQLLTQNDVSGFQTFLVQRNSSYRTEQAFGIGAEFALEVMHKARFKFALIPGNKEYSTLLNYETLEQDLINCRVNGYLEYCNHPFKQGLTEQDRNSDMYDTTLPFHGDFVVSDTPLFDDNIPDLQNFPLFVTGLSVIHNVPGIQKLVLDRATLAKIFRGCNNNTNSECLVGSISTWGHPDIKRTNPTNVHPLLDAAGAIKVVVDDEAETSAKVSTEEMKRALSSFEQGFAQQIGPTGLSWNGTNHIKVLGTAHGRAYMVSLLFLK
jgi:hypothetical protein